jgi:epoxyqueuosine reductase QueG
VSEVDWAKQTCRDAGFDKVGIAGPEHFKLPGWVRSVVVVGYATLDEAYDYCTYLTVGTRRKWHKPIYDLIVAQASMVAEQMRGRGWRAELLYFVDSASIIDLKKAAVLAGLGILGRNNLVVTPEYGPRIRLGCLFVDRELPPDRPGKAFYCSSCQRCLGKCPTEALFPDGFRREACLAEFAPSREMARRQKERVKHVTPFTRLQCIDCLTACPIGRRLPLDTYYSLVDGW